MWQPNGWIQSRIVGRVGFGVTHSPALTLLLLRSSLLLLCSTCCYAAAAPSAGAAGRPLAWTSRHPDRQTNIPK